MTIKHDPDTNKWGIGDGIPRYHTKLSAEKAYDNYLKRGGEPVKTQEKTNGNLG